MQTLKALVNLGACNALITSNLKGLPPPHPPISTPYILPPRIFRKI